MTEVESGAYAPSEPHVIAPEFCGGCGEFMGYDLRPLTLLCPLCDLIEKAKEDAR